MIITKKDLLEMLKPFQDNSEVTIGIKEYSSIKQPLIHRVDELKINRVISKQNKAVIIIQQ